MLKQNQKIVMKVVMDWCKVNNAPIPQIEIKRRVKTEVAPTTLNSVIQSLIRKNYLRKAINVKPISYVKLRSLDYYEYEEYYYKRQD